MSRDFGLPKSASAFPGYLPGSPVRCASRRSFPSGSFVAIIALSPPLCSMRDVHESSNSEGTPFGQSHKELILLGCISPFALRQEDSHSSAWAVDIFAGVESEFKFYG